MSSKPNPLTRGKKQKALALLQQGRAADAIALLEQVCRADPRDMEAHANLGAALGLLGRPEEAVRYFEHACRLDPERAELHYNLGNVLREQERHDEAVRCYREAVRRRPDFAEALGNLGLALTAAARSPSHGDAPPRRSELLKQAVDALEGALRLKPRDANAHYNLAVAFRHVGRLEEAVRHYPEALALDSRHPDAHEGLATAELLRGNFGSGWDHYRYRVSLRAAGAPRAPAAKLPHDLAGKRLLAVRDQGLGDELFFLRFAPWLKARGAHLSYRPDPRLGPMLARAHAADRIVPPDEPAPDADYVFSIGDLPWLLDTQDVADIPRALPLAPLPAPVQTLAQRLAILGPAPYLGVTWRAGSTSRARLLYKECPLIPLAHALRGLPGTVVVLQRHPVAGEIEAFGAALGKPAHDLSALNEDLEQMLALLSFLDDYVGVSNTNMHLRAGAGRAGRVLVPSPPEWRWMAEGRASPWFPGFDIYRQGYDGNWEEALDTLTADLHRAYGR